ncbi:MAG: protein kinase [Gemmatales bacterium]|nr:protein kinase [Gemmatales bacterium]MDW8388301.1 protein kinase [Gemmatales bacterium]
MTSNTPSLDEPNNHPASEALPQPTDPASNVAAGATVAWIPATAHGGSSDTQEAFVRPTSDPYPKLPGYEILGKLGTGGWGVVYKARQIALKRVVAIKMVNPAAKVSPSDTDDEPAHLQRFRRDAQAIARFQHPNIVQVFEIEEHEGRPFFALEYVDGGSLDNLINGTPQDPVESARWVETLARAVHYAHERQVIHRDLKPANILLTKDRVPKVSDFGMAKQLDEASSLTHNAIVGTPSYMAPEQADPKFGEITPLADVYGLGAILYECLTGRPPFKGPSVQGTIKQVLEQEPIAPSRLQPTIPKDLENICLQCLQKEPKKRYASAQELADDLRRFLNGEPVRARPVGPLVRLWRWSRRNPRVAVLLATVLILLTAIAITSTIFALLLNAETQAKEAQRQQALRNEATALDIMNEALELLRSQVTDFYTSLRDTPNIPQSLRDDLLAKSDKELDRLMEIAAERFKLQPAVGIRMRAGILQRKGDIALAAGQLREAEQHFNASCSLVHALVDEHPSDPLSQRAMGIVFLKLGHLERRKGNNEAAHNNYTKSLEARRRYLDLEPQNPDALVQMAIGYGALGDLALDSGDGELAFQLFSEEMKWRDRAAELQEENLVRRRERAALNDNLGKSRQALWDKDGALYYFEKSKDLRKALLTLEPANQALQAELGSSYTNIGDIYLQFLNNPAAARDQYQEAVKLREEIVAGNPYNVAMKRMLAFAYYRLATAHLHLGDRDSADILYARALPIYKDQQLVIPYILTLARLGQHGAASERADKLVSRRPGDRNILVETACCYALCAAALDHPKAEPAPGANKSNLAATYAEKAVNNLRQAVKLGWKDLARLETDPDLAPLRESQSFQAIVYELGKEQQISRPEP